MNTPILLLEEEEEGSGRSSSRCSVSSNASVSMASAPGFFVEADQEPHQKQQRTAATQQTRMAAFRKQEDQLASDIRNVIAVPKVNQEAAFRKQVDQLASDIRNVIAVPKVIQEAEKRKLAFQDFTQNEVHVAWSIRDDIDLNIHAQSPEAEKRKLDFTQNEVHVAWSIRDDIDLNIHAQSPAAAAATSAATTDTGSKKKKTKAYKQDGSDPADHSKSAKAPPAVGSPSSLSMPKDDHSNKAQHDHTGKSGGTGLAGKSGSTELGFIQKEVGLAWDIRESISLDGRGKLIASKQSTGAYERGQGGSGTAGAAATAAAHAVSGPSGSTTVTGDSKIAPLSKADEEKRRMDRLAALKKTGLTEQDDLSSSEGEGEHHDLDEPFTEPLGSGVDGRTNREGESNPKRQWKFRPKAGHTTSSQREGYVKWRNMGPSMTQADLSLFPRPAPHPIFFWQLYALMGEEPVQRIVRNFYTRVFSDDENPWFRDAFRSVTALEHAIWAQSAFWLDAFGGGIKYHGGEYRLSFHHGRVKHVMTVEGGKRWIQHLQAALDAETFDDDRVRPALVEFVAFTMDNYGKEFGFDASQLDITAVRVGHK